MHLEDTIVALATAPGPGLRAIVRLSGPKALDVAAKDFLGEAPARERRIFSGHLRLAEIHSPLPADLLVFPGPDSYTGQDVVEIHTISSPPLVDRLIARLLAGGARAAQPGEFTMRAFLAGKLDLPRAEAVLGVIEASGRDELRQALAQLAGGVTQPLQGLREDLLNLLADVEAGLDVADEDIHFVTESDLLKRIAKGLALLTNLKRQLERRTVAGAIFRVVLAGRPNAGKSSLFNALAAEPAALVSPKPGTTRDYLIRRLPLSGVTVELVDTAGRQQATDTLDEQAQTLGRTQAEQADLVLLCIEAGKMPDEEERALLARVGPPSSVHVPTKCDLAAAPSDTLATSAVTGTGL